MIEIEDVGPFDDECRARVRFCGRIIWNPDETFAGLDEADQAARDAIQIHAAHRREFAA